MPDETIPHTREPSAAATVLLGLGLTAVHFAYAAFVSDALFGLAGGIRDYGRWTEYGGIDWAWTNLAWLPGGLLLAAIPAAALALLATGSIAAGLHTAATASELWSGRERRSAWWRWRLWTAAACWLVWVPVPVKMTLTYWYTVAY
jgi:hypothetical protein